MRKMYSFFFSILALLAMDVPRRKKVTNRKIKYYCTNCKEVTICLPKHSSTTSDEGDDSSQEHVEEDFRH